MSMAVSSSSSSKTSLSPHRPSHFMPIEENGEEEEFSQGRSSCRGSSPTPYHHHPTPLNSESNRSEGPLRRRPENNDGVGVLCNKCRPNNRDKISVLPFENRLSSSSPNGIFKSILGSFAMKKSPRSSDSGSVVSKELDHWKIVASELSNKLVHASRKRDEAIIEASKLKSSVAELEKKLNKLEIFCHSLKSGLDDSNHHQQQHNHKAGDSRKVIHNFLIMVSEARSSVRALSRALFLQLRLTGGKLQERVSVLLQQHDINLSKNPRSSLLYLEAMLNGAFYEDFESTGFHKNSPNPLLNPIDHCDANFAMFTRLQQLTWDEVLSEGTRHFSEELSKFCDTKMSEIVTMLGWNHAWPEPLLQAFFGASKAIWLVHLLANSVHPSLPIFRVDKGIEFDPVYMEETGGDRAKKQVAPSVVRTMVTPGFYVYDNVVKCKVVCGYHDHHSGNNIEMKPQSESMD